MMRGMSGNRSAHTFHGKKHFSQYNESRCTAMRADPLPKNVLFGKHNPVGRQKAGYYRVSWLGQVKQGKAPCLVPWKVGV